MLKFIRGKGQQPSAERQKLQNELFAFRKVCIMTCVEKNTSFVITIHSSFNSCLVFSSKKLTLKKRQVSCVWVWDDEDLLECANKTILYCLHWFLTNSITITNMVSSTVYDMIFFIIVCKLPILIIQHQEFIYLVNHTIRIHRRSIILKCHAHWSNLIGLKLITLENRIVIFMPQAIIIITLNCFWQLFFSVLA